MKILEITLPNKSYNIKIEKGIRKDLGIEIEKIYSGENIFVITDENVYGIYEKEIRDSLERANFKVDFTVVPAGEGSKSLSVLETVYDDLLDKGITRTDMIVALGGGVVGDLAGFVASTLLRGIRFTQVPTSLLAQIDSSVGGKVAVNLDRGKNLVGSFYHPEAVFIDSEMLKTLEKRYLYDGISEMIKYGCIKDESLFNRLEQFKDEEEFLENIDELIYTCCNIKKIVVEEDERDTGNRMTLNFGHTIGHAIEKYFNYSNYSHGEAVAIGMYTISRMSEKKGETISGTSERIKNILGKYHLQYELPKMDIASIEESIKLDKKNSGKKISIILIEDIGKSYIKTIERDKISDYIIKS